MTSALGVTERQDYWYWSNWSCSRAYDKFVSFSRESYREPELNRPFKLLTKSSGGSEHSSAGTSANSEQLSISAFWNILNTKIKMFKKFLAAKTQLYKSVLS